MTRADASMAQFYHLKTARGERVAGLETDVVQLVPVDSLRFGYRIWTEQKTGLVVKLQTLDSVGRVLEQAAFSELQLGTPVTMARLGAMMDNTHGYRIRKPEPVSYTHLDVYKRQHHDEAALWPHHQHHLGGGGLGRCV